MLTNLFISYNNNYTSFHLELQVSLSKVFSQVWLHLDVTNQTVSEVNTEISQAQIWIWFFLEQDFFDTCTLGVSYLWSHPSWHNGDDSVFTCQHLHSSQPLALGCFLRQREGSGLGEDQEREGEHRQQQRSWALLADVWEHGRKKMDTLTMRSRWRSECEKNRTDTHSSEELAQRWRWTAANCGVRTWLSYCSSPSLLTFTQRSFAGKMMETDYNKT